MIKFLILVLLALLAGDVITPCKLSAAENSQAVALPAPFLRSAVCDEASTATLVWEYPKKYVGWFRIYCGTTSGRYPLTFDPLPEAPVTLSADCAREPISSGYSSSSLRHPRPTMLFPTRSA